MRIVFMASPDFALPALDAVVQSGHELVAVVTGTDKVRGRGTQTSPTVIKKRALELGLPVIEADKMRDPSLEQSLIALNPDLFVVVAFKILPPTLLAIPKKGSINIHASLLPKYRGAAPIHWAIINGEAKTGCTIFLLNEGIDEGLILNTVETPIEEHETTGEIYERLSKLGARLLRDTLQNFDHLVENGTPQDHTKASAAPKLFPETCKINFHQSSHQVHNFIRGLTPFPGAWTTLNGAKFKVHRTRLAQGQMPILEPGQFEFYQQELWVGCQDGSLILDQVQLEGKKAVEGVSFWNGYRGTTQFEA